MNRELGVSAHICTLARRGKRTGKLRSTGTAWISGTSQSDGLDALIAARLRLRRAAEGGRVADERAPSAHGAIAKRWQSGIQPRPAGPVGDRFRIPSSSQWPPRRPVEEGRREAPQAPRREAAEDGRFGEARPGRGEAFESPA